MKNKKAIEKTLNSMEGLQPASAGNDFYDKLKNRMNRSREKVINLRKDFRWQAVAAAILILLVTNVTIMLNYGGNNEVKATASEVLANEYGLLPENSYEIFTNYEENRR
ncbi:MAG: hypothetical protein ACOCXH_07015 [Cyclobacteriaceae bacterium]